MSEPTDVAAGEGARTAERYAWTGDGLGVAVGMLLNGLLAVVTCGLAGMLGYLHWSGTKASTELTRFPGGLLRYQGSWAESLGRSIGGSLLIFATCGLATPWVIVWNEQVWASHVATPSGDRLEFDGSPAEVIGLYLITVLGLIFSLGLVWPWLAIAWLSWSRSHTVVRPAEGEPYRLRCDAGGLAYLVQAMLSVVLILATAGLYTPWAVAQWRRWAWAATSDTISSPVVVPRGPQTVGQWAIVVGSAAGALTIVGLVAALGFGMAGSNGHGRGSTPSERILGPESATAFDQGDPGSPAAGDPTPARGRAVETEAWSVTANAVAIDLPQVTQVGSRPPTLAEWRAVSPLAGRGGSVPDKCFVKLVREWMKFQCEGAISKTSGEDSLGPTSTRFIAGNDRYVDLVFKLRPGLDGEFTVTRDGGAVSLRVRWASGSDQPDVRVSGGSGVAPEPAAPVPSPVAPPAADLAADGPYSGLKRAPGESCDLTCSRPARQCEAACAGDRACIVRCFPLEVQCRKACEAGRL